ncbi:MAG: FAD-dependent oxidoreductase [Candidatus Omnitrophica bacterium]|nr:FAD-dependent oxidoreductase [Candidatus Omnitrophota bacterium]
MTKKKIIILGAGLAGLSAAWHLKQRGIEATVFEKENSVGGLCRSKQVKGFVFDCDGHLLHFRNNYTLELVKKLLKGNLVRHERNAWINNFGIFSRYPFQANLHALPKPIANECLWGFIRATDSRANSSQENFLKWIHTTFGKGIARHFMIPYNKKFWTHPLGRMSCPWADKFIPQFGLSEVVNGFFENSSNHLGYNAFFWYPKKGGIIQLPMAFEEQIGEVSKNCCVSGIDLKKKEITVKGRGKESFDTLILTIPLPELIKIIKPLPGRILDSFNRLRWNSIFNLNLGVEGVCQEGKHWVYFPHKETVFFRAGFFHNFSSGTTPFGKSALYTEVSYPKNKLINRERMVKRILNDLHKVGILNKDNRVVALDTNDIKYGYPIYDRYYPRATAEIKKFLSSNNVIACGRYGGWQYMSMEDALLDGKEAASTV